MWGGGYHSAARGGVGVPASGGDEFPARSAGVPTSPPPRRGISSPNGGGDWMRNSVFVSFYFLDPPGGHRGDDIQFMPLEFLKILGLSLTAGIVCFFTAMVGSGSGLILVPLLILSGLSPVQAIAVHKFEALWTVVSGLRYWKNKQVLTLDFPWYLILGSIGTFLGAREIHFIPNQTLQMIVGGAILLVALLMIFFHKKPDPKEIKLWKRAILILSMFFFGIYEGTFGSGNGFFIAALFFGLIGSNEIKTVGMITILAAFWNIIATLTHLSFGSLIFRYALPIGTASMIGAWFGAGYAIHSGKNFVRKVIIILALVGGAVMLVQSL